jgi:hypothetical protein
MSKHETPLTVRYWESVGGSLIEEFPAVLRGPQNAQRLIDGVIVLDGQKRRVKHHEIELKNQNIIVIQTKASRLGMYLMGQALFSAKLMKPFNPKSIRTVALCTADDSVLRPLCEQAGIEVVVISEQ